MTPEPEKKKQMIKNVTKKVGKGKNREKEGKDEYQRIGSATIVNQIYKRR